MKQHKKRQFKPRFILLFVGLFVAVMGLQFVEVPQVSATTEQELRDLTEDLENKIKNNESKLVDLQTEITTLDGKVQSLNTEISIAQQKIDLTDVKILELKQSLTEAEAELERQKGILEETLVTLYIEGSVSSAELIFASDNFGQYFQETQYLASLKASVQKSVNAVTELRQQIAAEKQAQEELQTEQKANRNLLADKRNEQQTLLNQTKGEEAAFQDIVSDLQQQLLDAQKELEELLAAQNFVSLGAVNAGDVIGYSGNSGFSTGPHLHFAVYDNGSFQDPYAGGGQMTYGLIWPLPTVSSSAISQLYGCQSSIVYLTACGSGSWLHAGLDVSAWYGEPVVAAGDGDIVFRGWLGGYGNAVIVDHGGGILTYYAHLNE